MKIKQDHLDYMSNEMNKQIGKYGWGKLIAEYESGQFPRSDKVKDLQKRFCFDMSFGAGLTQFVCKELYSYLDDSHVYTALKAICPKVTRKY